MKVAIMQPYFFPYIGYWQLIANCDQWVYFDEAQFNKRSWMTRNRIFHPDPDKDFQFLNLAHQKVPLGTQISAVHLSQDDNWKNKILSQLAVYKRLKAPFYDLVSALVSRILLSRAESIPTVTDQAIVMLQEVFRYLGSDSRLGSNPESPILVSSKMDYERSHVSSAGEWALEISKSLGATEYINPTGGVDIFDETAYQASGIKLSFLKSKLSPYKQSWKDFHPGMSIIDVLMFNEPKKVRELLLNDFDLLSKGALLSDA
jgi:hypothetical protein